MLKETKAGNHSTIEYLWLSFIRADTFVDERATATPTNIAEV